MRSSDRMIRIISLLALTAILLYIGFSLLDGIFNPLKTTPAEIRTLENSVSVSGYIVRDEIVIAGNGNYMIIAEDESKISANGVVGVQFDSPQSLERASRIEEIKAEISQYENNLAGSRTEKTMAIDSILSLSKALASSKADDVSSAVTGLETHVFGERATGQDLSAGVAALREELARLESESQQDAAYLRSSHSGIFVSGADGCENIKYEDIRQIKPGELASLFEGKTAGPDAIGKVVSGLDWFYVATIPSDMKDNFEIGKSYDLKLDAAISDKVPMKLIYISGDENGKMAVIFTTNKFLSQTATQRKLNGEISLSSISGLAVPKSAVRNEEETGQPYVFVLGGLRAMREDIKIIGEDGDYYLVEVGEDSHLRRGVDIILKARDLYDGKVVQG